MRGRDRDAVAGRVRRTTALLDAKRATDVALLANGCVLAASLDDPPLEAPPRGPCPRAEVVLDEVDQVLRGRTLRVSVSCVAAPPPGCRGTARLGWRGLAGRGEFRVPAGARRLVEIGLSRRGLARVNRRMRRIGHAGFRLEARVVDGRVSDSAGNRGVVIDGIAARRD